MWDTLYKVGVQISPAPVSTSWDALKKFQLEIKPYKETNWLLIGGALLGVGAVAFLITTLKK